MNRDEGNYKLSHEKQMIRFLLAHPVYGLFDSSGKTLWLSVDHRRLRPVDDMVLLSCVVCDSGRTFARSLRASSLTERNKSILIDHATRLSIFF